MGGFKQIYKAILKYHSYHGYKDYDKAIYFSSHSVTDMVKFCYLDDDGFHSNIGDLIQCDDSLKGNYSIIDILYGLYHLDSSKIEFEEIQGNEYFAVRKFLEEN